VAARKKKKQKPPVEPSPPQDLKADVENPDLEKFRAEAEREFLAWKHTGQNQSDTPEVIEPAVVSEQNEDTVEELVLAQGGECWHCPVENCKKVYPIFQVEDRETHLALHAQILELESRVKRAIERGAIVDLGSGGGDDDFCDSSVDTYYTGGR
jgi:hypothetical protein